MQRKSRQVFALLISMFWINRYLNNVRLFYKKKCKIRRKKSVFDRLKSIEKKQNLANIQYISRMLAKDFKIWNLNEAVWIFSNVSNFLLPFSVHVSFYNIRHPLSKAIVDTWALHPSIASIPFIMDRTSSQIRMLYMFLVNYRQVTMSTVADKHTHTHTPTPTHTHTQRAAVFLRLIDQFYFATEMSFVL